MFVDIPEEDGREVVNAVTVDEERFLYCRKPRSVATRMARMRKRNMVSIKCQSNILLMTGAVGRMDPEPKQQLILYNIMAKDE